MYPEWHVTFISTHNENYSVYVQSKEVANGKTQGIERISFNVSGSGITVQITLGSHIYSYKDVIVSTVPVSKYYGPKQPPLAYTSIDVEYAVARGFVSAIFAMMIALLVGRKYALEKEKRSVIEI